jgi:hypothetical protein
VLTLAGGLFLLSVRLWGDKVARFSGRAFGLLSKGAGEAVENKIHAFHSGLDTIRSLGDFAMVAGSSLGMWVLISAAYLETMMAFTASPELAAVTPAEGVLLMIVSGGASIIQLPVLGWFTQIGLVAGAISKFFGVAPEAAMGCAATLLLITFLGIVPLGLIWSRFERISLKQMTEESEHAGVELAHHHGSVGEEAAR